MVMDDGDVRPIGVFDSGVGGLSVLREIARQLPHEDIVYVADTAHCPYGPRPQDEIRRLAAGIISFLIERPPTGRPIKLAVVACNTISAAALAFLRERFPIPIVGMVPAVKPAAASSPRRKVGVIATQTTLQAQVFAELVERFATDVDLYTRVCPRLVEQVERGDLDTAETEALLHMYLDPMVAAGIDTLVLGCTHYPFLLPAIQRVVGSGVSIIDPAPAIARQTERVLEGNQLGAPVGRRGRYLYVTTGDGASFRSLAERLLDRAVAVRTAKWVDGQLYEDQTTHAHDA